MYLRRSVGKTGGHSDGFLSVSTPVHPSYSGLVDLDLTKEMSPWGMLSKPTGPRGPPSWLEELGSQEGGKPGCQVTVGIVQQARAGPRGSGVKATSFICWQNQFCDNLTSLEAEGFPVLPQRKVQPCQGLSAAMLSAQGRTCQPGPASVHRDPRITDV